MSDDWRGRNVFTRGASDIYHGTGTDRVVRALDSGTADSNLRLIPGAIGGIMDYTREAALNNIIDPIAGKMVKRIADYIMDQTPPRIIFECPPEGSAKEAKQNGPKIDATLWERPVPKRMIDVDSGALISVFNNGRGKIPVYCILSHAWKGAEIEYTFFQEVQQKERKRQKLASLLQQAKDAGNESMIAIAEFQYSKYKYLAPPEGVSTWTDIDRVTAECNAKVAEALDTWKPSSDDESISQTERVLSLLQDHILANTLEGRLKVRAGIDKRYQRGDDEDGKKLAGDNHRHGPGFEEFDDIAALLYQDGFIDNLINWIPNLINKDCETVVKDVLSQGLDTVQEIINEFYPRYHNSNTIIQRLKKALKRSSDPLENAFFWKLAKALEVRKSAYKIAESARIGREIFDEKWKRYSTDKYQRFIWNDTCCINKTIVGEHQESLALMGEWYSNAEFCIAHIDTKPDWAGYRDCLSTYQIYSREKIDVESGKAPFIGIPARFDDIVDFQPFWSTRGWTLQELALSRDVFFVNSSWQRLDPCDFTPPSLDVQAEDPLSTIPTSDVDSESPQNTSPPLLCTTCGHPEDGHKYSADFRKHVLEKTNTPDLQPLTLNFERHTETFKKVVAKFGRLPTPEVCRGANPSKLPAYEILSLASIRDTTVPEDHVYSLMGMAGNVKFAAFHAEGLTKALSRLLDEILINSNDVSVFNWSGKDFGGPLSGRSLYPKDHEAYRKLEKGAIRGPLNQHEALFIDEQAQKLFISYQQLERVIESAQVFIRITDKGAVNELQKAFEKLLTHIENKPLDDLGPRQILKLGKLFKAMTAGYKNLRQALESPYKQIESSDEGTSGATGQQKTLAAVNEDTSSSFADAAKTASPEPPVDPTPALPFIPEKTPSRSKSSRWSMTTPSLSAPKLPTVSTPKFGLSGSSTSEKSSLPFGSFFNFNRQSPASPSIVPAVAPRSRYSITGCRPSIRCTGPFNCFSRSDEEADEVTIAAQPSAPPAAESKPKSAVPLDVSKERPVASDGTIDSTPDSPAPIESATKKTSSMGRFLTKEEAPKDAEEAVNVFNKAVGNLLDEHPESVSTRPIRSKALDAVVNEIKRTMAAMDDENVIGKDGKRPEDSTQHEDPDVALERVISPNPIIVNSSGIDAVVDIQRVKITFAPEEIQRLWKEIEDATSHNDLIEGKCTLGTGIATLDIEFKATAAQIKRQLDVCEVIEKVKLTPRRKKDIDLPEVAAIEDANKLVEEKVAEMEEAIVQDGTKSDPDATVTSVADEKKPELVKRESSKSGYFKLPTIPTVDDITTITTFASDALSSPTTILLSPEERVKFEEKKRLEEEKKRQADAKDEERRKCDAANEEIDRERAGRVQRVLRFVQQSDVTMLAGEWVLVRISGVQGANWFLCLLELGTTHEFYGTRIPCTEIDFERAQPEADLREYWKKYIREKKTGLCRLLRTMIDRKKSLMEAQEAKATYNRTFNEGKEKVLNAVVTEVWEETKMAMANAGLAKMDHWSHKLSARWHEFEEGERQRWLRDDALKRARIPTELHPAVLSLDDNKTLPSMFHAARQVHFF